MSYSTSLVVEHSYTIPVLPSWHEATLALKWARSMCESLGIEYSSEVVKLRTVDNDTNVMVIREVI